MLLRNGANFFTVENRGNTITIPVNNANFGGVISEMEVYPIVNSTLEEINSPNDRYIMYSITFTS